MGKKSPNMAVWSLAVCPLALAKSIANSPKDYQNICCERIEKSNSVSSAKAQWRVSRTDGLLWRRCAWHSRQ